MVHRWLVIGWLYLVGVVAAAQLGKMSALVPLIGAELALGLTTAAACDLAPGGSGADAGGDGGACRPSRPAQGLLWGIGFWPWPGSAKASPLGPGACSPWRVLESLGYLAAS